MILSASNIAWAASERLEAYRVLEENHFYGLEIAPSLFFWNSKDPFNPSKIEVKQATSELEAFGLELVSMQSILFGLDDAKIFGDETQFQSFLGGMESAIFLAGELKIPNIVFGCPKNRNLPKNLRLNEANDIIISLFNRLGDLSIKAGTSISIEPNPKSYGTNFLNTLEETEKFISLVNHPAIVPMLDTGALEASSELNNISESIPRLCDRLAHVHISEIDLKPAPSDQNKINKFLKILHDNQYSKAVSIEMRRTSRPIQDLEECVKLLSHVYGKLHE